MRLLPAFLMLLLMTGAAWAQCADTSGTPDILITPGTGTGCVVGTRAQIMDQSTAGGPILTGAGEYEVKIGNFPYTIAQAGSTGFGSGWSTLLVNVATGPGSATITTPGTFEGGISGNSISMPSGSWMAITADGSRYLVVGANYSAGPQAPPQVLVTGETTLGIKQNTWPYPLGVYILIGSAPITVTDLGRWVVSGNTAQHVVSIYDTSCRVLGSATVNLSGAPGGTFVYASLNTPVTLAAGQHYYVMSSETNGGDFWYDYLNTVLTTTPAATIVDAAFIQSGTCFVKGSTTGHAYGFPSFKFH